MPGPVVSLEDEIVGNIDKVSAHLQFPVQPVIQKNRVTVLCVKNKSRSTECSKNT